MRFSISNHIAYGFKPYEIDFERLKKALLSEHFISQGIFKNYHKTKENWIGAGDCFIFDFDYQVQMKSLQESLKNFKYLIHTTKSHNKLKNGILGQRFRLYLPSKEVTLKTQDEFEYLMKDLTELYWADPSGASCAHAFRGYSGAEFFENDGKLFDWEKVWNVIKEIKQKEPVKQVRQTSQESGKKDFMNREFWPVMFKPQEIGQGGRNNDFARIMLWAIDEGCDKFKCEEILMWLNSQISEPLPKKEIDAMLKGKFRY